MRPYAVNPICRVTVRGEQTGHMQLSPEMESGRVEILRPPVKPVETAVKFSFLATKKHLSTNRNIQMHFIMTKTFYKKMILTNHTF